jgi:hypothetical protein
MKTVRTRSSLCSGAGMAPRRLQGDKGRAANEG